MTGPTQRWYPMTDDPPYERRREDGHVISTDRGRLDRDMIHRFIAEDSYWGQGIPRAVFDRALDHSLPFGLYDRQGIQQGFARVTTDRATFGYLQDVFIVPAGRGRGLGKFLVDSILAHPGLTGFRRWLLATRDAHTLYAQYGFTALNRPESLMERHDPEAYRR